MTDRQPVLLEAPEAGPQAPLVEVPRAERSAELARERRGRPRRQPPRVAAQMTLVGTAAPAPWEEVVRHAKTQAERDALPVKPWAAREAEWRAHAESDGFKRRLDRALSIAYEGGRKGLMYAGVSGGKDSTALLGLLREAGVAARGVYASSLLDYPGVLDTVTALAHATGTVVDVLAPAELERHVERICKRFGTAKPRRRRGQAEYDEWDLLRALPADVCCLDDEPMRCLVDAFGHANLLTAHQYAAGYVGSFVGVRRMESLARHFNWRKKGPLYMSVIDEKWVCTPIVEWSGKDVWAYITSRGLPYLDYYRLAYETGLSRNDPAKIRTGGVLVYRSIAEKGVLRPVARLYPDLWRRLTGIRPELLQFV